jgi:predicted lipoprotein with Yx(FWY)xxD motif
MKITLALATIAIVATLASCTTTPTPTTDTIVSVGLSGSLLDKLYAGKLAGSKSGFTLYQFASDTKGGTTSACTTAPCVTNWPALTVTSAAKLVPGSGATKALATISRNDLGAGTLQVTYDGYPLYFYAGDTAVGDLKGATLAGWLLVAK